MAAESELDDLARLAMHLRDELRGTDTGRDPMAGARLMRIYEERWSGQPPNGGRHDQNPGDGEGIRIPPHGS